MAPTPSQLPGTLADSGHPQEGEYSGSYQPTQASQAPPQHYGQPGPYHSQPTYLPAPSVSYSQPAPQRNMAQAPYPYQQYTHPVAGPPVVQAAEPTHPTPSYVGSYNIQTQHLAGPYRSDPYYYSQSSGSPTAESPYGHQYMAFRQPHLTIAYPETVQTPSLASPSVLPLVSSPERPVGEQHIRGVDEVNYGSIATNYRHIITTVSQASPSPSTDSSNQSFEPPIVDDMLHRAVEGLRHLDPTRAEQYAYSGEFAPQMISSGVVAPESPAGTVFVQYYEDGKSEGNPTKKKVCPTLQSRVHQNLVHEEVINVRMRQKRDRKGATQCASCQATSTPEWRRGPLGPRTLCNACGLVYAKLMKKRAREEDNLSPGESPRRARSKGKARGVTEESEEDRITEQGSDDTLPPTAGPSVAPGLGYPP